MQTRESSPPWSPGTHALPYRRAATPAAACRVLPDERGDSARRCRCRLGPYSDDEVGDACIDAGARGYVIKDIERFDLTQSIRAVHRGEGVIAPTVAGRLLDRARDDGSTRRDRPTLNESQTEILRLISEGRVEAALRATREGWI